MVNGHWVNRILVRQNDTGLRFLEVSPLQVGLTHGALALQVLDDLLVVRIVQEVLKLVVRWCVLQYYRVDLPTAMVNVEELLTESPQCMDLNLTRDDDVGYLWVTFIHSALIRRLETH